MHLEINFEWDDEKAKQNKQKHNVRERREYYDRKDYVGR